MDKVCISFIIPVYNTASFVERCVNSILSQGLEGIEIILVNDGSTDESGEICQRLVEENGQIIYLEQFNCGLGKARCNGVDAASGDYIVFVDSDDTLKADTIEELRNTIISKGRPDIVEYGYQIISGSNSTEKFSRVDNVCNGNDYFRKVLDGNCTYEWYAWKYAYRTDFWKSHRFEFPTGKYEDVSLIPFVVLQTERIMGIDTIIYQYNLGRVGAITTGVSLKTEIDKLNVIENNIRRMDTLDMADDDVKKKLQHNMSLLYYSSVILAFSLKGNDRHHLLDELDKRRWITGYTQKKDKGQYIVAKTIKLLGIKPVSYALNIRRIINSHIRRIG